MATFGDMGDSQKLARRRPFATSWLEPESDAEPRGGLSAQRTHRARLGEGEAPANGGLSLGATVGPASR
jgi:hypothetical protein